MWTPINHDQLKACYQINKITKLIRSNPYPMFKNGEIVNVECKDVIRDNKGLVHLNHNKQYSFFNVDKLWEKTFNSKGVK